MSSDPSSEAIHNHITQNAKPSVQLRKVAVQVARSQAAMKILGDDMTPEEALRNILSLVDGSDEVEDVHALQILLQSIKTLAEKGLGRSE